MILQQQLAHAPQRLLHRRNLDQNIGAIAVLVDHPLQPTHLAFDAAEALGEGDLSFYGDVDGVGRMGSGHGLTS
jgi:hypothetical protein